MAYTTYDFDDGTHTGPNTLATRIYTFTEGGAGNTAKFTFSVDPAGPFVATVTNPSGTGPTLNQGSLGARNVNSGPDMTLTFTAVDTAITSQDKFSGTVSNPVAVKFLNIGAYQLRSSWAGSVKFSNSLNTALNQTISIKANTASQTIAATGSAAQQSFTSIKFINGTSLNGAGWRIDEIRADINCFCAGTRIATPTGPVAVETLTRGDRVLTADGGTSTVKWLGEQPVNVRLSHPAKVNPIRITAGALGTGLPERDLMLSADHAIAIDGHLINAGALVNGETIYQVRDMPLDGFTYYHVETEAHELLLAEGVAAESFIDYAGTDSFANADDRPPTAPIPEMTLPRISAARLVPERIRLRLQQALSDRRAA